MTNTTGQVVETDAYLPFGALARRTGLVNVPQKFTGHHLDSTGLYYFWVRYYDPSLGRFLSADPTIQRPGDPQDLNRYSYCRNNPLKYIDPSGYGWFKKLQNFIKKSFVVHTALFGQAPTTLITDPEATIRQAPMLLASAIVGAATAGMMAGVANVLAPAFGALSAFEPD